MRHSDQCKDFFHVSTEEPARAVEIEGGLLLISVPVPVAQVDDLTRTERAIAELVMTGLTNAEIAARRECSSRTVANHVAAIFVKLGVNSRRELKGRLLEPGSST